MVAFSGHRTQFYVDIVYGAVMVAGFGYLLLVEMNPVVVAFLGGAVFGYILRVWENMSVYERAIAERAEAAVEAEAEAAVTAEAEDAVPEKAEEAVAAEVEEQVDEELADDVEERVDEEIRAAVEKRVGPEDAPSADAPSDSG